MNHSAYKDEQLDQLAALGNVAQFISFSPGKHQRFSRIAGEPANKRYRTASSAICALLESSSERRINIRSFTPEKRQGNEFVYGLDRAEDALSAIDRLSLSGMYVIANETIDVNDGGVSGVAQGGLFEFAPGATPRIVETGAVTTLDTEHAKKVLHKVYNACPTLPTEESLRVEFSIHPLKRGVRKDHTILWEAEESSAGALHAELRWPNLFSELIGDKTFGLLVADSFGFRVPHTTVLCRKIPPFSFGTSTGEDLLWMRTAPRQAEPGLFPTVRGWTDPFKLMEDNVQPEKLASVLVQQEVKAQFSGAMITSKNGGAIIEGVKGFGDDFMLGKSGPAKLPSAVHSLAEELHSDLRKQLGRVRIEWAYDGEKIWVIQLQQITIESSGKTIVAGTSDREITFEASKGLDALRALIQSEGDRSFSICLVGNIGMTSHFADVLRRHKIPSRIA